MAKFSDVFAAGKVAVITGASSGIGRATAVRCASLGMKVFLADNDEAMLAAAHAQVAEAAPAAGNVVSCLTDVGILPDVAALKDKVFASGGKCHFLFNNAGVGRGGDAMVASEQWQRTMDINTYGPIYGCQAFVPAMQAGGEPGIIVNTGSKQGITMPPGNLFYNVSKAALKCYTEGLEHELRNTQDGKLRAGLLVPGWVNTSIMLKSKRDEALAKGEEFDADKVFFHEAKPAPGAWMPEQVVDFMMQELEQNKFYMIAPDNDVDQKTDNLRMTWAMQDITEGRPPLSRWHPDHKDAFNAYLEANK